MSRALAKESIRVHVTVYKDDWEQLLLLFGQNERAGGGRRSEIVRELVHNFVRNVKEKGNGEGK